MLEKLEFYHGAALVRLIEDPRCQTIGRHTYGYHVNKTRFIAIKYSTKARSPWGFTFSQNDIVRLRATEKEFGHCVIAFVCGGDGVCGLPWTVVVDLLGNAPGGISAKRAFAGCYAVSGPAGMLKGKVAMNRWPSIVFDGENTN